MRRFSPSLEPLQRTYLDCLPTKLDRLLRKKGDSTWGPGYALEDIPRGPFDFERDYYKAHILAFRERIKPSPFLRLFPRVNLPVDDECFHTKRYFRCYTPRWNRL